MMIYVLMIILILFPVLITLCEFHALFAECLKTHKKGKFTKAKDFFHHYAWSIELVLYGICFWFEYLLLDFMDVKWSEKWTEQLYNLEMHQPINPDYAFGYTSIILFFFASIVALYMTKADRTPPLITGLSIAGLYVGSAYSIIWTVHISGLSFKLLLFFLPINTVLISLRLLVRKIHEYQPSKERMSKIEGNRFLSALNSFRQKAIYFPVLGFILVIPLLGAIVLILIIFGQAPDSAIKAFTETSDFLLSQKMHICQN